MGLCHPRVNLKTPVIYRPLKNLDLRLLRLDPFLLLNNRKAAALNLVQSALCPRENPESSRLLLLEDLLERLQLLTTTFWTKKRFARRTITETSSGSPVGLYSNPQ